LVNLLYLKILLALLIEFSSLRWTCQSLHYRNVRMKWQTSQCSSNYNKFEPELVKIYITGNLNPWYFSSIGGFLFKVNKLNKTYSTLKFCENYCLDSFGYLNVDINVKSIDSISQKSYCDKRIRG
jgi:hypothetical protein